MTENQNPPEELQESMTSSGEDGSSAVPEARGSAIPLPPADSGLGAYYPTSHSPEDLAPTGPTPLTAGAPTPPSGTYPNGAPTPPSGVPFTGVWTPPPTGSWGPEGTTPPPYGYGYGWGPGGPWPPGYAGAAQQSHTSKRRTGLVAGVASVVVLAAVLAGAGLGHVVWPHQGTSTASGALPSSNSGSSGGSTDPFGGSTGGSSFGSSSSGNSTGAGAPSDISSIASRVDPGLVDINTNLSYQDEQAAGTGMVLTSNGIILTNNHVIDGATSISVTDVGNGKTYAATVVGYDRTGDVAVIKLTDASGLQTVTTASGSAAVGEAVVGIGNAGGTGGTPSTAGGSVTALNQSITASDDGGGNSENLTGLIEVDAGIEPGDSGGSLVNTSGQVIGMDTAASTDSGYDTSGAQAYAIPIGTALSIARQIEAGKSSSVIHIGATAFLGVSIEASSDASSSSGSGGSGSSGSGFGGSGLGSGDGGSTTTGAVVEGTVSGLPAAEAGLAEGDVITALNGTAVTSPTDFSTMLASHQPGDTVQLTWTDQSGQSHTASIKLASGPPA